MAKSIIVAWLILFVGVGVRNDVMLNAREAKTRAQLDSIARVELAKDIVEIKPNWHPEIEKYFISAKINPKSGYAWCGYFKHYINLSVGIPGRGGWAAAWISDKRAVKNEPVFSDGFAIRRNGGSGWHVGHISEVHPEYLVTIEGNIKDRLLSRKIIRNNIGIVYFSYINLN